MMRPVLAVLMGARDIQDRAMDMKLRIVLPACPMREGRPYQVSRYRGADIAAAFLDPRITAMFEHRVLQRRLCRIDGHPLDLRAHSRFRDRP